MNFDKIKSALQRYIEDKQPDMQRMQANERYWNAQNWRKQGDALRTPWLLNSLMNKHADAMDNYPQAVVLPRYEDDVAQAESLSKLLPMILRQNRYEDSYSDMWWEKLKHGTAAQGVFWDSTANQGRGDICIKNIDLMNLFYQKGIQNIQDSPFVFYISSMDREAFANVYPDVPAAEHTSYFLQNPEEMVEIVDCYYKKPCGRQRHLHFCKFCGEHLLYASEEDPLYVDRGYYKHGLYPFVLDRLYAIKNSPLGFGLLDIMKDGQNSIDELNRNILEHTRLAANKRYFVRLDGGINEAEFADSSRHFVHVAGALGEESIREIAVNPLDSSCFAMLGAKIEELKETSGNRDVNQGSVGGGITAASAINALQEAGNKLSRDMIKASYRAFVDLCTLLIELVREFYNTPRMVRIGDAQSFVLFQNEAMQTIHSETEYRLPEYDIVIQAQKASPFSTLAQNELAKEFYRLGFFEPQNADKALACIAMMNFDGKEELIANLEKQAQAYRLETAGQAGAVSIP